VDLERAFFFFGRHGYDGRVRARERFTAHANEPLAGDLDLATVLGDVPPDHTVKGMFFSRLANAVGTEWNVIARDLRGPPSAPSRYHAFEPYPMVDYLRLIDAVARTRFPQSAREGYRLLARGELEVFAESTLGKVTLSLLRDPAAMLLRYPDVSSVLMHGPKLTSTREGDRKVRVTYEKLVGSTEAVIGLLESMVIVFDFSPTIEVDIDLDRRAVFNIAWS
jgi:uncharacterized protein (TIGR02265 family)